MPVQVLMPALSPTMTEGTLAKWLKKEGDTVDSGDVLAEIETDKATMELEAVDEGVLGRILVPEGTEGVAVNTPVAVILAEGEDASAIGYNAQGGIGCISVTANVAPALCAQFQEATLAGDYATALDYQDRLMPLHTAIFVEPGLVGAKYGLSVLGRCSEEVRSPLVPLTEPVQTQIRAAMVHAGLINA